MKTLESEKHTAGLQANEDPITHEPGSHPVATGVGAASGAATGAAIGLAVGGPVGGIVGGVICALAGSIGGNAVGEAVNPTQIEEVTREEKDAKFEVQNGFGNQPPYTEDLMSRAEHAHPSEESNTAIETSRSDESAPYSEKSPPPSHEEIAAKAWSYYEAEGRSDGNDWRHWFQAESDLHQGGHR